MLQLAIVHCGVPVTEVHGFPCASGYRGKNCEENIDDCPGNLCQNGATCVDDINRYSCLCPPTYMGELCEQDVDECGQRPSVCQNGATCTNSIGGFSCICVNGWAGPDCSVNIDDCAGAACFNGATCIDRVGSFYCRCTPGKTGTSNVCSTVSVLQHCSVVGGASRYATLPRFRQEHNHKHGSVKNSSHCILVGFWQLRYKICVKIVDLFICWGVVQSVRCFVTLSTNRPLSVDPNWHH
jgi:hypothetical protein